MMNKTKVCPAGGCKYEISESNHIGAGGLPDGRYQRMRQGKDCCICAAGIKHYGNQLRGALLRYGGFGEHCRNQRKDACNHLIILKLSFNAGEIRH